MAKNRDPKYLQFSLLKKKKTKKSKKNPQPSLSPAVVARDFSPLSLKLISYAAQL
jgi:hypothetical protein